MNEQIKMTKKHYWLILAAVAITGTLAAVFIRQPIGGGAGTEPVEWTFPSMSTLAQVKFYERRELAEKAGALTQEVFLLIEKHCNTFAPESELYQLNQTAHEKPFKCSDVLWQVLVKAREAYQLSDGLFDPTIRPLMELWGFYRKRSEVPPQSEIDEALKRVGFDKVVFDDKARTVAFKVKGVGIDLGGIAKGYAVDMAAENVRRLGVKSGIINLGGNIYCFPAPPPNKRFYTVSVRNPLNKDKGCGVVRIQDQSVSTSGNYERYVTFNGKNYTHIVNPKTGLPVEDMLSVTALCRNAVDADMFSTMVFVGGPALAEKLYRSLEGVEFLIMVRSPDDPESFDIIKYGNSWDSITHAGI
jgi:thiamine biosynthesis lipoprotein